MIWYDMIWYMTWYDMIWYNEYVICIYISGLSMSYPVLGYLADCSHLVTQRHWDFSKFYDGFHHRATSHAIEAMKRNVSWEKPVFTSSDVAKSSWGLTINDLLRLILGFSDPEDSHRVFTSSQPSIRFMETNGKTMEINQNQLTQWRFHITIYLNGLVWFFYDFFMETTGEIHGEFRNFPTHFFPWFYHGVKPPVSRTFPKKPIHCGDHHSVPESSSGPSWFTAAVL